MLKWNGDWRVVGQFCATQAYNRHICGDKNGVIDWSELGVEIYKRLQELESDSDYDDRLAEMRLRANAIVFCGVDQGKRLLDPSVVESWFFSTLPGSIDQIRGMALNFVEDDGSPVFLTLRHLKERISLIKGLVSQGVFSEHDQLEKWSEMRNELP